MKDSELKDLDEQLERFNNLRESTKGSHCVFSMNTEGNWKVHFSKYSITSIFGSTFLEVLTDACDLIESKRKQIKRIGYTHTMDDE